MYLCVGRGGGGGGGGGRGSTELVSLLAKADCGS